MKVKILEDKDYEGLELAVSKFSHNVDVHSIDSHYNTKRESFVLIIKYWEIDLGE